ncbi:hypothetical protein DDZ13_12685 [Coraliomargarita sinensis]|uniref:Uncharacterized protein n=1 Tax=Coraliomargarita sinensis TaxID=2174842 RepID=A0A317ZDI3_9BACT|nr:hypothetical protein DDZ13_12685 [Coraliomargarita sinensis]
MLKGSQNSEVRSQKTGIIPFQKVLHLTEMTIVAPVLGTGATCIDPETEFRGYGVTHLKD